MSLQKRWIAVLPPSHFQTGDHVTVKDGDPHLVGTVARLEWMSPLTGYLIHLVRPMGGNRFYLERDLMPCTPPSTKRPVAPSRRSVL